MVLLFLYFLILYYIRKEIRLCSTKEFTYFTVCTIISCFLAIAYRTYLISSGIKLGLANLDMQYYMSLAETIQDMSFNDGFNTISSHWNFISVNFIQIWGYRFYIYFLVFTIFRWSFLSTESSVYLVSIWQLLLAAYCILKLYNVLKDKLFTFRHTTLLIMLLAPPIWYGCVRLLREPFMLLFITLSICCICNKQKFWLLKLSIYLLFLFILRPYYAVFMIPILLMIDNKIKTAFIIEGGIFVLLAVLCIIRGVNPLSIVGVILSPNFFNQIENILFDLFTINGVSGEVPVISLIGSIWNLIVVYYVALSIFLNRNISAVCWCNMGIILDLCMTYGLAFGGSTELRHKIFFILPLIIILNHGALSHMSIAGRQKTIVISGFLLLNLMLGYTLIVVSIF